MFALGDKGYNGLDAGLVTTPLKGKPEWQKDYSHLHARLRGPGERAFPQLKTWSILVPPLNPGFESRRLIPLMLFRAVQTPQ